MKLISSMCGWLTRHRPQPEAAAEAQADAVVPHVEADPELEATWNTAVAEIAAEVAERGGDRTRPLEFTGQAWQTQYAAATNQPREHTAGYLALGLSPQEAAGWANQGFDPALTRELLAAGYHDAAAATAERDAPHTVANQVIDAYWQRQVEAFYADQTRHDGDEPNADADGW